MQATDSLKLSAPWHIFISEIKTLFAQDPEITVESNERADGNYDINIYVRNRTKALALDALLPGARKCGGVTVYIDIFPANDVEDSKAVLYRHAFESNPIFNLTQEVSGVFSNPLTYVEFKPEVAQYYSDNLHDIHGNTTTLYQEIAKDIFGEADGVCFCTGKKG